MRHNMTVNEKALTVGILASVDKATPCRYGHCLPSQLLVADKDWSRFLRRLMGWTAFVFVALLAVAYFAR